MIFGVGLYADCLKQRGKEVQKRAAGFCFRTVVRVGDMLDDHGCLPTGKRGESLGSSARHLYGKFIRWLFAFGRKVSRVNISLAQDLNRFSHNALILRQAHAVG